MKIAITGHRPNKLFYDYNLKSSFVKKIKEKIEKFLEEKKPDYVMSGMALGIDTLFALIALEKEIPLIAAIPFEGQETVWPKESQDLYKKILDQCYEIKIVSEGGFSSDKMMKRNKWMVNNCDILIAVWNGSPGGTANCIRYARLIHKEIFYINLREID